MLYAVLKLYIYWKGVIFTLKLNTIWHPISLTLFCKILIKNTTILPSVCIIRKIDFECGNIWRKKWDFKNKPRYHNTSFKMAKIQITYNTKCFWGYGATETLYLPLVRMQGSIVSWWQSEFSMKLKQSLTQWFGHHSIWY